MAVRSLSKNHRWPVRLAAPIAVVALASACLVTNKVEFGEEDLPPIVERDYPANDAVRVPTVPDVRCDESGEGAPLDRSPSMEFAVQMREPNLGDPLEYRLVVNGTLVRFGFDDQGASSTGWRRLSLCAPPGSLLKPCNYVEFLVSKRFAPGLPNGDPYKPLVRGDLARVSWLVLPSAEDDPTANVSECAQGFDGGVP